jgi:pilus assembly protein FimV
VGKRHIKTGWLVLVAFAAAPTIVMAAGLGRLVVQSGLGQPLKGEIEIVAPQRGELETLTARLAPVEAFRQAHIEYGSALPYLRFNIERRQGRAFVVVSSTQPIQEPFLDILVELNWSGGRLVREYTVLLDPAEYKGPQAITAPPTVAAAPVETSPVETPRPPEETARPPAEQATTTAPEPPPAAAPSPVPRAPTPAPAPTGSGTYQVQRGDTLAKIAAANRPEGVTQQQMLVALFRANEDAFINRNMNLLRVGRILNVPDKTAAEAIAPADANRVVVAQAREFNEYRSQAAAAVAATPAQSAEPEQRATGRITARVEEPASAPGTAPKDQLRLSKPEDAGKAAKAARADDLAARDKAIREANERVAELEKNMRDLQKLVELKNQQLAQLEKQAQAAKAAAGSKPPETPKPVEPPKVAVAPPPAPTPKPAETAKPVEAPKPVEQAKPAEAPRAIEPPVVPEAKPGAEPPKPPEAQKADTPPAVAVVPEAAPKAKPRPVAPPPPESSFVDELLDNPMAIGAGGLALLALLGFGAYTVRRQRNAQLESSLTGVTTADSSSVFGSTGGRNVDTGASSLQTDFSQSGLGAIDTDEVDPVAEADVYMAYGRDAQAEEILKEALQKDPNRQAVRVKLLEIYAARKDLKAFETTAGELYAATEGRGPDWEKATALGLSIDPTNPMYGGKNADLTSTLPPGTVILPGAAMAASAGGAPTPDIALDADETLSPTLDFDLGGGSQRPRGTKPDFDLGGTPSQAPGDLGFDLNLGEPSVPAEEDEGGDFSPSGTFIMDASSKRAVNESDETQTAPSDLQIDFELPQDKRAAPPAFDQTIKMQASQPAETLDFDLAAGKPTAASQPVDLSAISFDLGEPAANAPPVDARWQEVATKLDLAKAYDEMGDKDGARELLNEVIKEGDSAQQHQAKTLLEALH